MFRRFGIRARLLFAFFGISMFAVLAAAAALYSFIEIGKTLHQISRFEAPMAMLSLELSRQAEQMVGAAPALLMVTTEDERGQIWASLSLEGERLDQMMLDLKIGRGVEDLPLKLIEWTVSELRSNLEDLNDLVSRRLGFDRNIEDVVSKFRNSHGNTQQLLADSVDELDYKIEVSRVMGGDSGTATDAQTAQNSQLVDLMASRTSLQDAQENVSAIYNLLLEAEFAKQPEQLTALAFQAQIALGVFELATESFHPELAEALKVETQEFRATIGGPANLFSQFKGRSSVVEKAREVLTDNSSLSSDLTATVDQLVDIAKKDINDSISEATSTQQVSTLVLMVIVALSLISSILIVWLYVGRNLIARLTELSASMESVAGGDLKVHLPSGGADDEIGRMTKALTVFRDTAVEIQENNLREIGQARQRLIDAIESISEGFCYYDSSDKLVVANNRYRALMYPGHENAVTEGMTFEQVIRNAVEQGYIKLTENRVDEWVAERLARHRKPGTPHVHQRGDGRWIMVSERKTGDAGTVAIYSDITELKQREKELSEKSKSMEQLSNQISKYLSPQIYESIFTGKREVKVASHRRKLSIFFSDIAGFTETAELLESEDLTNILNHYLTEMSEIALQHGATIDKYVGDAIVIFLGDPESRGIKEDALACVNMAIAMRQRMKELQGVWRDAGIAKPLQCRIGINTGFCTVGNFGSEDRMDYTIIGSGVNLASRLESAASPGEILISFETYAMVKDKILCENLGIINAKGIPHPIETYQVVDAYENLGREQDVIHEDFPNFNLNINLEELSVDERSRAVAALSRALDTLGDSEDVAVKTAPPGRG
jgi:class 3 adenylate cyclase